MYCITGHPHAVPHLATLASSPPELPAFQTSSLLPDLPFLSSTPLRGEWNTTRGGLIFVVPHSHLNTSNDSPLSPIKTPHSVDHHPTPQDRSSRQLQLSRHKAPCRLAPTDRSSQVKVNPDLSSSCPSELFELQHISFHLLPFSPRLAHKTTLGIP